MKNTGIEETKLGQKFEIRPTIVNVFLQKLNDQVQKCFRLFEIFFF